MASEAVNVEALHQQAEREVAAGNNVGAVKTFQTILDAASDDAEAQVGYVRALLADKRIDEARAFLASIEDSISDGRLWSEYGRLNYMSGEFEQAAAVLKRGAELLPDDGHITANYGFALWESGKRTEALDVLRSALPKVQDDANLSGNMGQIFMQLGMWNEAVSSFERYLLDFPNDLQRRVFLGFCLKEAGWKDEAETVLQEILTIDPQHAQAKAQLEALLSDDAADDGAISFEMPEPSMPSFEMPSVEPPAVEPTSVKIPSVGKPSSQASPRAGSGPIVGFGPKGIEVSNSAPFPSFGDATLADFADVTISDDDDGEVKKAVAELTGKVADFLRSEDVPGGMAFLERELMTSKVPGEVLNILGKLHIDQEDYEGAVVTFKEAIESDPFHAQAHSNLGVLLWQMGEFEEAIEVMRKAVELDTADMDARINLALICHQIGLYEEATALYMQFLDMFPEDIETRMELADCFAKMDEKEAALRELDTVLLLEPDHEEAQKKFDELSAGEK
ncbi:MAG: tetratricopeptide repeat protein [Candidatus Poribacteria bacterium]|nr:tetratricopeptide repeat protein [Candidatus Poribacteria bacterium]